MSIKTIICPNCDSRIDFEEGTIVEGCVACKTKFQTPDAVKVSAKPDATVVQVQPITAEVTANG